MGVVSYSDPILAQLRSELRLLRRGIYPFAEASLSKCPGLVAVAGLGSTRVAWRALSDLYETYADDVDGDVRAYFESAGYGLSGETLELRLLSYAEAHSVEQRTARRRSDRGIEQIIRLIYERGDNAHPEMAIAVVQSGATAYASVQFRLPRESGLQQPFVEVNGIHFDMDDLEFRPMAGDRLERFEAAVDVPPAKFLDPDQNAGAYFRIRVRWLVPTWPVRGFSSFTSDPRVAGFSLIEGAFSSYSAVIPTYNPGHPLELAEVTDLPEHPAVYEDEIQNGMPWPLSRKP